MNLDRTRVLVVGGSSGIGEAVARGSLKAGADVTIASRSAEKLAAAAARLGGGASTDVLDATDDDACEAYFKDRTWDHVVITAAEAKVGPIGSMTLAAAQAAMDSKFWGTYRIAKHARITPDGSLTFVSGVSSQKVLPGRALMAAMNAAIETLARGLALDFAPVRVNVISPGYVQTAAMARADPAHRQAIDAMVERLPLKRMGQPEYIADAIATLMTNPYLTGTTLYIDGGFSL